MEVTDGPDLVLLVVVVPVVLVTVDEVVVVSGPPMKTSSTPAAAARRRAGAAGASLRFARRDGHSLSVRDHSRRAHGHSAAGGFSQISRTMSAWTTAPPPMLSQPIRAPTVVRIPCVPSAADDPPP